MRTHTVIRKIELAFSRRAFAERGMMTRNLYHYTSVESLALILANKSIKFNALKNLDDPLEAQFNDFDAFGSLCFVSSWTDDPKERHEMWSAYSSKYSGVRIALETNPFKVYENPPQPIAREVRCKQLQNRKPNDPIKSLIPIEKMRRENYTCSEALAIDNLLIKVGYVEEIDKLRPTISEKTGLQSTLFHLDNVGRYKGKLWEYQNEWRYRLTLMPRFLLDPSANWKDMATQAFRDVAQNRLTLGFESIYLELNDDAFARMTITMSPCVTDANRAIVQALVGQYNPNATLRESELKGYIQ